MAAGRVDLPLMAAWLAARSLSRGLPTPVLDSGGVRVDTGHADERQRYVFVQPCEGLRDLGQSITRPFVALKLCGPADDLLAMLPGHWAISSRSWVMGRVESNLAETALPDGYDLSIEGDGPVWAARIVDRAGVLAASGYAVEQGGVFFYDRIRTEPAYERRGLGRALMTALGRCRRDVGSREILTATAAGRALYLTLGWRDLAPYSTAMIPPNA
jgi:GNAT superfamily N-acetyltransferase